jgi:uncharacterized protein
MLIRQDDEKVLTKNLSSNFSWAYPLFEQLGNRFSSGDSAPGFPCIFAQKVFALRNIRFLLVPFSQVGSKYQFQELSNGLSSYLDDARDWDGNISTAEPLLVMFEPQGSVRTTSAFEKVFFESLQYLIDHDTQAWRRKLPKDPNAEFWSMCFGGTEIFINVSHPNHQNRRSRNLCDALVFVINPRERFDKVAGNDHKGHLIRERIRGNIDLYDKVPRSQYLGHYLAGELEWPQYMLPDDNESPPLRCPLSFK